METSSALLDRAIRFATDAHSGVCRKGSDIPYILHPLEAAAIVATLTDDRELMAAAVLHDTIEDAGITAKELEEKFGARVAALVVGESENKRHGQPPSETWHIRKQETLDSLTMASMDLKFVAMGDKLSNLRAFDRDYKRLGEALWLNFNQCEKSEHAWYYHGIAKALAVLSQTGAYQEYMYHLKRVFG